VALNIKNASVEHKVRRLAQLTGESISQAVERAADERLARLARERKGGDRVNGIISWLASLPPLDPADDNPRWEAEMYDDDGLPR
jgi:antitoxin VapB